MDEEEFADWKTELVSFKADWAKSAAQPVAPVTPEDTDATATADDDLDDLDPASPRVTAAQLLKLKKQIMASINVPSTGSDAIDGISDDVKKEYASMWDEKEDK
jgi:hypothetical protein